jgi:hypothetical protein
MLLVLNKELDDIPIAILLTLDSTAGLLVLIY